MNISEYQNYHETKSHTAADFPYNTYLYQGLPAGPISNPGLAAIRAALDPQPDGEAADAYFFVTDLTGRYYYARTLAEHQANVRAARAVNAGL